MKQDLLTIARSYGDTYGWSVIRLVNKKPVLPQWLPFKTHHPTDKELADMFDLPGTTGIGVICGPVSNDLVVRDFDVPESYERWAKAHPDLAETLPTARTRRGYHVYFRSPGTNRIQTLGDGELRGNGYVAAPPSMLHNGFRYEWLQPPDNGNLLVLDPGSAGLASCWAPSGEPHRDANPADPTNPLHAPVYVPNSVEEAIERTLPDGPGQRNQKIFWLALYLRSILGPDAKPDVLRPIVRDWHAKAIPFIRTKDFSTTWTDFIVAWRRIKSNPVSMAGIVGVAMSEPDPPEAMAYDDEKMRLLVRVCCSLQKAHGDRPFFLSVREAGKLLGVGPMQAWRRLETLEFDGVLSRVKTGTIVGKQATTWRYVGHEQRSGGDDSVEIDEVNRRLDSEGTEMSRLIQ